MTRRYGLLRGIASWSDAGRAVAAILGLVALAWVVRTHYGGIEAWLTGLGAWAAPAFLLVHAVIVPLGFPVSVLGLLAGATFGWLAGTLLLLAGGLVSASIMYAASRGLLAGRVRELVERRPALARMADLIDRDTLRLAVLLRLSPLHFALVCYLLGASRIGYLPYLLTSLLVLPSAVFQAYLGHAARVVGSEVAVSGGVEAGRLVYLGVGLAATATLSWILGRIARRALAAEQRGTESEQP